jgi:hypothetical protein
MPRGGKRRKYRVTVIVCVNMDGSQKMPLLITGKSEKPRCLKHEKFWPWHTDRIVGHDSLCTVHRVPSISGKENSSQNWKILLLSDQYTPLFPLWHYCCARINRPKSLGIGKSDFKFVWRTSKTNYTTYVLQERITFQNWLFKFNHDSSIM